MQDTKDISAEELYAADDLLQRIEEIDQQCGDFASGSKRRAAKLATIAECCRGSFRLRGRVYAREGRCYLVVPAALLQPERGKVMAFAMSDEDTLTLELTVDQYNALPYHWFESRGAAPKGAPVRPTLVPVEN